MKQGMLVTFEGGEGCGKSTQIERFKGFLAENDFDFLCAREPGGTEVGEKIRDILLHEKADLSSQTEFLLFSSSRALLVKNVIKPALESGKIVVLDRFYDSSYTYQGYAGNLPLDDLKVITRFATGGLVPDLTFLLDLSYDDGMSRKSQDEMLKNLDRIESKGKAYHDAVRAGYLKLASAEPQRIVVIDASKSKDEIFESIKSTFLQRYKAYQK